MYNEGTFMGALTQISLQGTECKYCKRQSSLTQIWISVQNEGLSGTVKESLLGSVVFYPLQYLIYHQRYFFPRSAICSLTLSLKEEVILSI
jgi:hypothetical protein